MYTFVLTLHIVLCVLLVLIILMQPGKGGDVSSAFGGGSATQLFGAAGPGNFLTRGTGVIAALFMVTSLTLAYYSDPARRAGGGDAVERAKELQDEGEAGSGFGAQKPAAPAPTGTVPTSPTPDVTPAAPAVPAGAAPVAPASPSTAPTP
jgi:preprotein translocase subunit SecG